MATSEEIVKYAKGIENSIKDITSEYDKEKAEERVAKLLGGIAVIK